MSVIFVAVFSATLLLVQSQENLQINLEETKPGVCYKVHNPDQPRFYPNPRKPHYTNLHESCTQWIKHDNTDCLSLKTQNDEILILSCIGVKNRKRPGCYKIINRDKREEIVCRKFDLNEGCNVITTRTNLNIVIGCYSKINSPSLFDIKTRKPPRE